MWREPLESNSGAVDLPEPVNSEGGTDALNNGPRNDM